MYVSLKSIVLLILSCQLMLWGILVNYLWSLFFEILINFPTGSILFQYQIWGKKIAITFHIKSQFQFCSVRISRSSLFVYSTILFGLSDKIDAKMTEKDLVRKFVKMAFILVIDNTFEYLHKHNNRIFVYQMVLYHYHLSYSIYLCIYLIYLPIPSKVCRSFCNESHLHSFKSLENLIVGSQWKFF